MKNTPGHRQQSDDRERCIYPAQPSKVEPFLKVKVRRPSAQASMVTQVYSHTFDANRRRVADRMESSFFNPAKKETAAEKNKSEQLLALLAKSPGLADLLLTLAGTLPAVG